MYPDPAQTYQTHRATLDQAIAACHNREHWSVYPEMPSEKIYGEGSKQRADDAFKSLLNQRFQLSDAPTNASDWAGAEQSPYGFALGVHYPCQPIDDLIQQGDMAYKTWTKLPVESRLGICLAMLNRLSQQSFLIANAVMHTTGQPYVMAFQAGGPHALDRGLEAVTYATIAQTAHNPNSHWQKPTGKDRDGNTVIAHVDKSFVARGLGISAIIGCATFPTWNSYPGLFASLATGNSVIIKPAASAILPLAMVCKILRQVLTEHGIDANVVQLCVPKNRAMTAELLASPLIKTVDYTGGNSFADALLRDYPDKRLYLEKSGINNVLIDSTDDYRGLLKNLAFSLALYSGQMCTAPQNIYLAKSGIATDQGPKSYDDFCGDLADAVNQLLSDPKRAEAICGCLHSDSIQTRVKQLQQDATNQPSLKVLLEAREFTHEAFAGARAMTPLIIATQANDACITQEQFGPISFVIACDDKKTALASICDSIAQHGALTTSLYVQTSSDFYATAKTALIDRGAPLSINFTRDIYVNQSAAFSDFHGNALTPAANTSLTDLGFVASRFAWITVREMGVE